MGRGQLAAVGVSGSTISRWVTAGRLHRIHPSVYAVGHRALSVTGHLNAALLYGGPGSALSHQTGAWWLGLLAASPRRVHITCPSRRRSWTSLRVHHHTPVPAVRHKGLPVTSVPRTLLDLAATMRDPDLRRALAEADHRGLLDPAAVRATLGRGRPGSAPLRAALDSHLPELASARSVLEERFLALCESAALPIPKLNAFVGGLMVDAFWREQRLVAELDGHDSHDRVAAAERDRRRDLALRTLGCAVVRYTWQQVTRESGLVVADLRRALAIVA